MPVIMNLWKVDKGNLVEVTKNQLNAENRLENWITKDPSILGIDLLPIGRQVKTDLGGRIDILCVDRDGNLVILELKRDKTPRDVVAQILEYASWVSGLSYDEINSIAAETTKKDLSSLMLDHFGEVPENFNAAHSMIIVASSIDTSTERIVQYLSGQHNLNINVVFFTFYKDGDHELLGRAWLEDPDKVQEKAESKKKGIWSGYWFVNVGEDEQRNWEDNVKYGYIGAGQGPRYPKALKHLRIGDKIFAYMSGLGYVGYGEVVQEATMIKDFIVESENKPLLELPLKAEAADMNKDDPELSEWVVGVKWIATFSRGKAKTFKGAFANQNVVCKLRDETTMKFLEKQFNVSSD